MTSSRSPLMPISHTQRCRNLVETDCVIPQWKKTIWDKSMLNVRDRSTLQSAILQTGDGQCCQKKLKRIVGILNLQQDRNLEPTTMFVAHCQWEGEKSYNKTQRYRQIFSNDFQWHTQNFHEVEQVMPEAPPPLSLWLLILGERSDRDRSLRGHIV